MNELEVLKKQLPEMASIMNALPGNRFDMKSAQTILIVQRRMAQSELSKQLGIYVKLEFIDYMYRDAKKRLIGYIRDHGLRQQDLEGCLGDLLDEEWYKINM